MKNVISQPFNININIKSVILELHSNVLKPKISNLMSSKNSNMYKKNFLPVACRTMRLKDVKIAQKWR